MSSSLSRRQVVVTSGPSDPRPTSPSVVSSCRGPVPQTDPCSTSGGSKPPAPTVNVSVPSPAESRRFLRARPWATITLPEGRRRGSNGYSGVPDRTGPIPRQETAGTSSGPWCSTAPLVPFPCEWIPLEQGPPRVREASVLALRVGDGLRRPLTRALRLRASLAPAAARTLGVGALRAGRPPRLVPRPDVPRVPKVLAPPVSRGRPFYSGGCTSSPEGHLPHTRGATTEGTGSTWGPGVHTPRDFRCRRYDPLGGPEHHVRGLGVHSRVRGRPVTEQEDTGPTPHWTYGCRSGTQSRERSETLSARRKGCRGPYTPLLPVSGPLRLRSRVGTVSPCLLGPSSTVQERPPSTPSPRGRHGKFET